MNTDEEKNEKENDITDRREDHYKTCTKDGRQHAQN